MVRIFGSTVDSLEQALNFSVAKNKAIAQNIANVDTPNYKAKNVVFKDVLAQASENSIAAKRTHPRHIPFSGTSKGFEIQVNQNSTYNHNGNNVDMDQEMSKLAENQIYYNSMVDRFNGKMRSLQMVIRGGN